jgi:1-acyl-sn-glycerol-3-phosphate acyltransferase
MIVFRNILFYIVFYLGSLGYTSLSLMVRPFNVPAFRRVVRGWARYQRTCVERILGMRIVFEGERPTGPALYAIKHESFFEAIDLPNMLDYPVPFGKEELYRIPGWGRAAKAYGSVTVYRTQGAKALRSMMAEARGFIASRRPLAIFPEGTRVPHGTSPPLRAGFAGLYKLLGLPVVPVALNSGPLYHRWWKRPGTITMHFGEPIEPGLPREEIEARVHAAINILNS